VTRQHVHLHPHARIGGVVEEADRSDRPHLHTRQADRRAGFEAVDGGEGRGVLHLSPEEALVAREDEDEGHEEDEAQRDEKAHADQKPPFSLPHDAFTPVIPSTKLRTSGMVEVRISSGVPTARMRLSYSVAMRWESVYADCRAGVRTSVVPFSASLSLMPSALVRRVWIGSRPVVGST